MKKRFFLRRLQQADAERMLEWMKSKDVMRYLRIDGENMMLSDVQNFIYEAEEEIKNFHRAVTSVDGKYYGTISLKNIDREKGDAEYAIVLHPEAIGAGAAIQASKELLRIGFEQLHLNRIYLNVMQENQRAIRLYQKLGFRYLYSTVTKMRGNEYVTLEWYEIGPMVVDTNTEEGKPDERD